MNNYNRPIDNYGGGACSGLLCQLKKTKESEVPVMETRRSTAVNGDLSMEVEIIISPAAADEPPAQERFGDDAARAPQQDQSPESIERSHKLSDKLRISSNEWQWLQVGGFVVAIAVVWGLLSLPVIFYHLPQDQVCIAFLAENYVIEDAA